MSRLLFAVTLRRFCCIWGLGNDMEDLAYIKKERYYETKEPTYTITVNDVDMRWYVSIDVWKPDSDLFDWSADVTVFNVSLGGNGVRRYLCLLFDDAEDLFDQVDRIVRNTRRTPYKKETKERLRNTINQCILMLSETERPFQNERNQE